MIYLILQIIFSSAFTLIIKWAQMRGREDVIAIGAVNYIVAALAILPFVFQIDFSATSSDSQLENQTARVESAEFASAQIESGSANETDSLVKAETKAKNLARSPVMGAMITGGAMGGIYFIAFFFAIYAIKTRGRLERVSRQRVVDSDADHCRVVLLGPASQYVTDHRNRIGASRVELDRCSEKAEAASSISC